MKIPRTSSILFVLCIILSTLNLYQFLNTPSPLKIEREKEAIQRELVNCNIDRNFMLKIGGDGIEGCIEANRACSYKLYECENK